MPKHSLPSAGITRIRFKGLPSRTETVSQPKLPQRYNLDIILSIAAGGKISGSLESRHTERQPHHSIVVNYQYPPELSTGFYRNFHTLPE